jgi:hypothetical protein
MTQADEIVLNKAFVSELAKLHYEFRRTNDSWDYFLGRVNLDRKDTEALSSFVNGVGEGMFGPQVALCFCTPLADLVKYLDHSNPPVKKVAALRLKMGV